MVKANVDKILEVLRQKNPASLGELSKAIGLKSADIQKSAEYLEQDGVVKIEHKFPFVMVTLVRDPEALPASEPMPLPPPVARPSSDSNQSQASEAQYFNPNFVQQPRQEPAPPIIAQMPLPPPVLYPANNQQPIMPSMQQMPGQVTQNITIIQPPIAPVPTPPMQTLASPAKPEMDKPAEQKKAVPEAGKDKLVPPQFSSQAKPEDKPITLQNFAPQTISIKPEPIDPLDMPEASFNLAPPMPGDESMVRQIGNYPSDPSFGNKNDIVIKEFHIEFPSYIQNDVDKIEFLLEMIEKKIGRQDYSHLNVFYRKAYEIFSGSGELSPNEIYLLGERLKEQFDRLKEVYLVEQVAA